MNKSAEEVVINLCTERAQNNEEHLRDKAWAITPNLHVTKVITA